MFYKSSVNAAVMVLLTATMAAHVSAQEAAQRVEITGSAIKRIDGETALPVQVITRKEIERSGAVNVEQLIQQLSVSSSSQGLTASSASGATTGGISAVSLRGLGSQRTLILLNGRRIAPYGQGFTGDSVSVDVNSIPVSALERVEVLKEGASAVYGSDAIAGVINFILRKDVRGGEISVDYSDTSQGGGSTSRFGATYGAGDLDRDRYNFMVTALIQSEKPLFGRDRSFASSGINVATGNDVSSGNVFPGNVFLLNGALAGKTRNPAAGTCPAPYAIIDPLNNPTTRCRFDPSPLVTLLPKTERLNLMGALHVKLAGDWEAFGEVSWAHNTQNTVIQPVPLSDQFALPSNNPLFNLAPYNGNYPNDPARFGALAGQPTGLTPGFAAIVLSPNDKYYPTAYMQSVVGAGNPLPNIAVRYRSAITGNRDLSDISTAPRITLGLTGSAAGWDLETTYLRSQSKVREHVNGGYPAQSKILPLLNSGNVNLFGSNDAATIAAVNASGFVGDAFNITSTLESLTFKGSRDLFAMAGGMATVAVGVEERKESLLWDPNPTIQTGDISGYGGNFLTTDKSRSIGAVFVETNAPLAKGFDLMAAVRYDHYAGVGNSVTPKVGLRWQPSKALLVRSSISNGFRAPSLQDLYLPNTQGVTTPGLSDSARCPTTGSSNDCATQFSTVNGGNTALKPEKSRNFSLGLVLEPAAGMSLGLDYWRINLKDEINNGIPASVILDDQAKYGYLIRRGAVDPAFPALPGPIVSILQTNLNVGAEHMSGLDIDAKAQFKLMDLGKLTIALNGTYLLKDEQENLDGSFSNVIGSANSNTGGAIIRWKHYLSANLTSGDWDYTLAQRFQAGYDDLPSTITGADRRVAAYETYDFAVSYNGIKNLRLKGGIKNLFNKAPPYSNAGGQTSFQAGYDPQYGDPRGRTVAVGLTYSWK